MLLERVEPIERADPWTRCRPYVEAVECIRVRTVTRGKPVEAVVLGWRGDRVYLTWRSDMGKHLGWLPATDVELL